MKKRRVQFTDLRVGDAINLRWGGVILSGTIRSLGDNRLTFVGGLTSIHIRTAAIYTDIGVVRLLWRRVRP